ncbi:NAD(P)/FAD-dependent oxidoreductase [Weissella diestrammenae]|uniref:NAD(P)/FAD-dependent oxidoreductase n=1 Tax=Weissella diestrammenae TaxID=1162633 RepID=A0A7G9T3G1_9LACO|nr:NAD(P)/FAD-dependent oxidoreductase [Weissella diestrammenae]MCM0582093.1 NAD(P)/FAD-dependent oxidoreductase [Weissella diestrammenae]QNN74636.1 NAD(P)/FAD-dependent oxidoreductase [Weissella diestrammenae]
MEKYDVLFIGAGQAAWNGAIPMAQKGLRVLVIEKDKFGGVCSNRGCNAKILLDRPFLLKHITDQMQGRVFENQLTVNWADLMAVKQQVIGAQDANNRNKLIRNGVTVIRGEAKFIDNQTVQVHDTDYTADKIVIAAGTRPHQLTIVGNEYLHFSDDFLDLPEMPTRLTLIGGGLVATELASISAEAGAKVTMIVRDAQLLKGFYEKYVTTVTAALQALGVEILYQTTPSKIDQTDDGLVITTNNQQLSPVDYIVDATGRTSNADQLGLENTDVICDENGWVKVNAYLQTNVPQIYATGDVTNHQQPDITPVAAFESKYLGHVFTHEIDTPIVYPIVPRVVFTIPRLAQFGVMPVGTISDGVDENGHTIKQLPSQNDWFKLIQNETASEITLVYDQAGYLIGAAAVGYAAEDEINGLLPYAQLKMDRQAMDQFVWLFPTLQYMTSRNV